MLKSCRIAIADDDDQTRRLLRTDLERMGHEVIAEASNGDELIAACGKTNPDLILTDIRMPGIDGLDAVERIVDEHPLPIILLSGFIDEQLISRASACRVFGYLIKPYREVELSAIIAVTIERFQEYQLLVKETTNARQALDDRKHIERAKGIIMARRGLDEASAFRHLRQMARSNRIKMIDVAKSINLADSLLATQ
jgi:response regulator NasT